MLLQTMLITFVLMMSIMIGMWLLSVALRNASIVDPFWGTGFVIVAFVAMFLNPAAATRVQILVGLTTAWGLRLSLYLLWRNMGHGEDRRYAAMRDHYGPRFWWQSLFIVFLLQGAILWFVSLPIQVAVATNITASPGWLDGAGIVLWVIGFYFETAADWQLSNFRSDPANSGRVMDRGVWRLTRHPNYFGDFCVWWGLYLISVSGGGFWTIGSPMLMSLFLMKISGVTLLESTIADRRPEYASYKMRTNAFFPGPRRPVS